MHQDCLYILCITSFDVKLNLVQNFRFQIVVPGVIDKSPNVIKRDTIYIRRPGSDDEFEMSVEDVLGDKVKESHFCYKNLAKSLVKFM